MIIRAIVMDIEGTTSSISFVKDVLFPYARGQMDSFVSSHREDPKVRRLLVDVATVEGRALSDEDAVAVLVGWIDADRKITPLKELQGMIWEAGYANGDFHGHVYSEVPRKLHEWNEQGLALYVYSSGSVHAQKLLFSHTEFGDLTPLFQGYFDTHIGAKQEAGSYKAIAEEIHYPPQEILFLSDVAAELDAAKAVGIRTCQLLRPGAEQPSANHPHAVDFDGIKVY